jgi:hypothetical protein
MDGHRKKRIRGLEDVFAVDREMRGLAIQTLQKRL